MNCTTQSLCPESDGTHILRSNDEYECDTTGDVASALDLSYDAFLMQFLQITFLVIQFLWVTSKKCVFLIASASLSDEEFGAIPASHVQLGK